MTQNLKRLALCAVLVAAFCVYAPRALAVAPSASNLSAAETYTEDTSLNLVDIVVTDGDSATTTATLTLSNVSAGSLTTGTSGSVTSTYVAGTGVWSASGTIADVNVLLAGVTFVPASNFNASFSITTSVTDGVGTVSGSKAVTGIAVNDAPGATNLSAAESYTEDTSLNLIDIVVSDVDSANVTATLTLSNPSAGSLSTATSGAVTSTYVAGTGVWSASGAIANVNVLLAGVTFVPASNFNASFTIATSVSDGVAAAITGSKAMTGIAVNDPPSASNLSAAETYTEDTSLNLVDIVASDVDSASITATLTVSNPAVGSLSTATSGSVTSTYVAGTGVWTASGAIADVNTLLAGITFVPTTNGNASFTIATSVSDGVAAAITGSKAVTGTAVNDPPSATNLSAAETYTEDTTLNLVDIVASDIDNATVIATLTLSNPSAGSLTTGTSGSVTSTYIAGTGVWTASGAIADVNTLLSGVSFVPTANGNSSFTITTNVSDGALSVSGSKAVTGTPVNDAPVLDISKSPSLGSLAQGAGAPTGAVGTLISSIVDFASPAGQVDNVSDSDSGALLGVAVTGVDTGNFICYYSLNGGTTWSLVGAVSNTTARLLAADSDNRIYCYGATAGSYGSILTIRAWDQTSGADGGTASAAANGGITAFSANTDTVSITVTGAGAAPTGFSSGTFSDPNADGKVDRLTVVITNAPLTSCDVSNTELASDWTYNGDSIGGSITSASCNASTGTITFVLGTSSDHVTSGAPTLAYNDTDGDHSIANASGNLGTVGAFTLSDNAAPALQEGTAVPTFTNDNTPNYSFFSTEAGTITYLGGCTSASTSASPSAPNTITFATLADGTYSSCTLRVTDGSGNQSLLLAVTTFTVDTTAPNVSGFSGVISGNTLTATWTTDEAASTQLYYTTGAIGTSTSVADTNPGTTSHTVTVSGVDPCNPYTVRATSADATGNSTQSSSINIAARSCGGALPAVAIVPPVLPTGGFQTLATRKNGVIVVTSNAGDDIKTMALSATPDFAGVGQIPYSKIVEWASGAPGYQEGAEKLYIKFYTAWGQSSEVISANIVGNTKTTTLTPANASTTTRTTLFRDGATVYLVIGQSKYGFATMAALTGLGYSPRKVQKAGTSAYHFAGVLRTSRDAHPVGSWVTRAGVVYHVSSGGLVPVPSWSVLLNNGGAASYLVPANTADMAKPLLPVMTVSDSRVM